MTTYRRPPASTQALALVLWLTLAFITAAVGAIASVTAASFYGELVRPSWAPPAWLFGPMWSTLYTLMGVAAWLVWREGRIRGIATKNALTLFIVQLAVNALWSWLFFAWRQGASSFAEIIVLWVMILATLVSFWRINRVAGLLLLPYLAWVTLATALTFSVWQANPGLLGG
jgi:translocator protein